ncbi:AMP-binding protein [Streptomyces sp. NPDC058683]|uniref:AMP-binding protein n=1 Tax=Streptomyces sp. NPDC058683 TaxID=3346597 RepID=UPI003669BBE1
MSAQTGAPTSMTAYDWLRQHAYERPSAVAVVEWREGTVARRIGFAGLARTVDRVALALVARGGRPGDRVVLALPNDVSFTTTLLAAFAAGLVAVPAPPPVKTAGDAAAWRLRGIADDCGAGLVITRDVFADDTRAAVRGPGAAVHTWEDLCATETAGTLQPGDPAGAASGIAFLQYSSGSTGRPKGVAISHRAVAAQCAQAARVYRERTDDTAVTWVPLSHDMGLVTGVLRPLRTGYTSVLLSPREFARTPRSWLSALSALRGTLSSAPDFAYDHCVRRVPAAEAATLDLSSWRVARSAGEVVRAATADRFAEHFAPAGFRPAGMCPSYGMAEATLTVTASTPARPALRLTVLRRALQAGTVSVADHSGSPGEAGPVATLLSSGEPLPGTEVRVRDAQGRELPDGQVGELWIRGPQLFDGYWPDIAPGRDRGAQPTRDQGFLYGGQLFVLGRTDDTVVHQGSNHYATDIAAVLSDLPGLRPGRNVVFAAVPPGSEAVPRVCLVAELSDQDMVAARSVATALQIRRRLAAELGLYVQDVALLPPRAMPMTTSGKVRIAEVRHRYEQGLLPLL